MISFFVDITLFLKFCGRIPFFCCLTVSYQAEKEREQEKMGQEELWKKATKRKVENVKENQENVKEENESLDKKELCKKNVNK